MTWPLPQRNYLYFQPNWKSCEPSCNTVRRAVSSQVFSSLLVFCRNRSFHFGAVILSFLLPQRPPARAATLSHFRRMETLPVTSKLRLLQQIYVGPQLPLALLAAWRPRGGNNKLGSREGVGWCISNGSAGVHGSLCKQNYYWWLSLGCFHTGWHTITQEHVLPVPPPVSPSLRAQLWAEKQTTAESGTSSGDVWTFILFRNMFFMRQECWSWRNAAQTKPKGWNFFSSVFSWWLPTSKRYIYCHLQDWSVDVTVYTSPNKLSKEIFYTVCLKTSNINVPLNICCNVAEAGA